MQTNTVSNKQTNEIELLHVHPSQLTFSVHLFYLKEPVSAGFVPTERDPHNLLNHLKIETDWLNGGIRCVFTWLEWKFSAFADKMRHFLLRASRFCRIWSQRINPIHCETEERLFLIKYSLFLLIKSLHSLFTIHRNVFIVCSIFVLF